MGKNEDGDSHLKVVDFDGVGLNVREGRDLSVPNVQNIVKTKLKTNEETSSLMSEKFKEILVIFGSDSTINIFT